MENIMDFWENYREMNEKMFTDLQKMVLPQDLFNSDSLKELFEKNQVLFQDWFKNTSGENALNSQNIDEMMAIWNDSYQKATQAYLSMIGIVVNEELDPSKSGEELFKQWKDFYYKNEKEFSDAVKKLIVADTMIDVFDQMREKYMLQQGVNQKLLDSFYSTTQAASRKDIARIASLIVNLESKVDLLQEEVKSLKK